MAETIQRVYQLIIDAGGSKAGAEIFRQSAEKIDAAAQKAAAAGKPIVDNVAQQARAYERLRREIDPLYAAEVRLAQGLQLLETRFRTGNLGAEELSRDVAALKGQFDRAAESARRLGSAGGIGAGGARQFGTAIQQAGYQVGDFAVQVASGGGVLRPFIQQGTQLISMFGPWGAVIGAAGAVLGALATAFMNTGDATEDAATQLENYEKAIELSNELTLTANDLAKVRRLGLIEEAKTLVEGQVTLAADTLLRLENARAMREQYEAMPQGVFGEGIDTGPIGDAGKPIGEIDAAIAEATKKLEDLQQRLKDLNDPNKLKNSESSTTDLGADAISTLEEQLALYGDLTNEERALYETSSGRYKDESAAEKEQIVSLARILDLKEELTAANKEQATAAAALNKAEIAGYDAIIDEASRAWDARVKSGQKLTEEVRTPLEIYLAKISELNVALSVGTINQETYNRQVAKAQDSFDEAADGATYFRDVADDAMGILQAGLFDAAFAADNLNEALRGVLISLAKMAANKAFGAIADKGLDALFGLFGGGPSVAASTGMSTVAANGWSAFINHSGGTAGRGQARSVDPSWFSAAPRYHGGGMVGLAPNEVPIIAEKGETIRTTGQEAALQQKLMTGQQASSRSFNVTNNIKIEGSAGKPEENDDLAEKMRQKLERSMRSFVREVIVDETRGGGELNKSAMTF